MTATGAAAATRRDERSILLHPKRMIPSLLWKSESIIVEEKAGESIIPKMTTRKSHHHQRGGRMILILPRASEENSESICSRLVFVNFARSSKNFETIIYAFIVFSSE
jgi:hypothetical protein